MEDSPYTPGAGHRPQVLAGRDELLRSWRTGLNDVAATGRRRAPDMLLLGPPGVGKTATVLAFQDISRADGYEVVRLHAAAGSASLVDSLLWRAHVRASDGSGPWQRTRRIFERLATAGIGVAGSDTGVGVQPRRSGILRHHGPEDLADALAAVAREVRGDRPNAGLLVTVDGLQAVAPTELTLLAGALQTLNTDHADAPVMFAATGLPHTTRVLDEAGVMHSDRLFRARQLPLLLDHADAVYAIAEPARQRNVAWECDAVDTIVRVTRGYPAYLQLYADQTWMAAAGTRVVTFADAERGVELGNAVLERETFGPRLDRLTPREQELMVVLAAAGGSTETPILAKVLERDQQRLSEWRDRLLKSGDLYAPERGELALTVPAFGPYLIERYERTRASSSTAVLSLNRIRRNLTEAGEHDVAAR